jgi:pyruvate formate lyase activating enzyme
MRFALNDGPGIRTTIFLKGCPLACVWCHNPESQSARPELMFAEERCIACGDCVDACRHDALEWGGKPIRSPQRCASCGACCQVCATEARRWVGSKITAQELLSTVKRDRILYDESGGGVTFSGGEPLSQPEFLIAALALCRSEGFHTVVDTCGYADRKVFDQVRNLSDMMLFDLKLMDSDRHREVTGAKNERILANLRSAMLISKPLVVRIPVVPGVNDDERNISATIEFLGSVGVKRVDLLAYHQAGREKYRRLGLAAPFEAIPPTEAQMQELKNRFDTKGFEVRIGG